MVAGSFGVCLTHVGVQDIDRRKNTCRRQSKKRRGFPLPLRHGKTNQWCYFATYLLSRCYLTGKNGHTTGMTISETIMQIIVSPVPHFR